MPRFLALFLALSLALPANPAFALRTQNAGLEDNSPLNQRIDNALHAGQTTAAGMEESGWRRSRWVRVIGALLVGATMFGGFWMLPRQQPPDSTKVERLRTELRAQVAPGSGLYFWETGPATQKEMTNYLPPLIQYVRQHQIRKLYIDIPLTDKEGTVPVDEKVILDFPDFEKRVRHWEPFLSGLRKEGVQVWLTYTASWWPKADPEYDRLGPSERPSKKWVYDPQRFEKERGYAVQYDMEYALPVHARFHVGMLKRAVASPTVRESFDGVYLHLEPEWSIGWKGSAPDPRLDQRYLEVYLKFLEDAHRVTAQARMPLMVNSWQGALPMPEGLYGGKANPPLLWQGRPLLSAVQDRADVVNVWLQWVDPSVTADHLNQILERQNPAIPLEITLELGDDPRRPHPGDFSPDRLWKIVREVRGRWPDRPFSVTLRGFNPGATAAPEPPEEKKAGAEEPLVKNGKVSLERLSAKIVEHLNRIRPEVPGLPLVTEVLFLGSALYLSDEKNRLPIRAFKKPLLMGDLDLEAFVDVPKGKFEESLALKNSVELEISVAVRKALQPYFRFPGRKVQIFFQEGTPAKTAEKEAEGILDSYTNIAEFDTAQLIRRPWTASDKSEWKVPADLVGLVKLYLKLEQLVGDQRLFRGYRDRLVASENIKTEARAILKDAFKKGRKQFLLDRLKEQRILPVIQARLLAKMLGDKSHAAGAEERFNRRELGRKLFWWLAGVGVGGTVGGFAGSTLDAPSFIKTAGAAVVGAGTGAVIAHFLSKPSRPKPADPAPPVFKDEPNPPVRPPGFGKGKYKPLWIGGEQKTFPPGSSEPHAPYYLLEFRQISLKDARYFSVGKLAFHIARAESDETPAPGRPSKKPKLALNLFVDNDWYPLPMVPLQEGIPLQIGRGRMPAKMKGSASDLEGKPLGGKQVRPVSDERFVKPIDREQPRNGGFGSNIKQNGEERIIIYWKEKGKTRAVYLPRAAYSATISRWYDSSDEKLALAVKKDPEGVPQYLFIPNYLQPADTEIRLIGDQLFFHALGGKNPLQVEVPSDWKEDQPVPPEGVSALTEAVDVKGKRILPGKKLLFPFTEPFTVSVWADHSAQAVAEFRISKEDQLEFRRKAVGDGVWKKTTQNIYIAEDDVPLPGQGLREDSEPQSRMGGPYRVQYLPEQKQILVQNLFAYELRVNAGAEEKWKVPASRFRDLINGAEVDAVVQQALAEGKVVDVAQSVQGLFEAARKAGYEGKLLFIPRQALRAAPPERAPVRLFVPQTLRPKVEENFAGSAAQFETDPQAKNLDFIIADIGFDGPLGPDHAPLLQVDFETVGQVTPALLAYLKKHRPDLLQPGTILVIGKLYSGALGEGLLIFA